MFGSDDLPQHEERGRLLVQSLLALGYTADESLRCADGFCVFMNCNRIMCSETRRRYLRAYGLTGRRAQECAFIAGAVAAVEAHEAIT